MKSRMFRHSRIAAALALVLLSLPGLAWSQGRALPALSSERALIGGSPLVLPAEAAQMRFSLDGLMVTGHFEEGSERSAVDDGLRALRFDWDTAFSVTDILEVGARLELSYRDDVNETWLGPEMWAGALRVQALAEENGPSLSVGAALGQRVRTPSSTLLELDAVYGVPLGTQWRFDLSALLWAELIKDEDPLYGAGAALGPLWRPLDRLEVALDLAARTGSVLGLDEMYWDARAALRVGVLIGDTHELALSGRRTVIGERVDEETAALLTWQFTWMTEEGFLRLDDDGGPSPEPDE